MACNCSLVRLKATTEEVENKLITIALAKADGNRDQAVIELGISVHMLQRKIKDRRENYE